MPPTSRRDATEVETLIRPDLRPLRDAKITDFQESKPGSYVLTYDVRGKKGSVSYVLADDGFGKVHVRRYERLDDERNVLTAPTRPCGNDRRPPPPPPRRGEMR